MEDEEHQRRIPVWMALSDFFLDTDLDERSLDLIAKTVKESGYSVSEIKQILMDDLFPALLFNLHDVAGEWADFPQDWLLKRIEDTRNPNLIQKAFHQANFWMVKDDWVKLESRLNSDQVAAGNVR